MGLTMSQWDDLDDHDRAWALGVGLADAEAEAEDATTGGSYASYIPPGCTGYGLEGVETRGTSSF